jgi:hypothetical protein
VTEQSMLPGMPSQPPVMKRPRGWSAEVGRGCVQRAVDAAGWDGVVLPYSNLSDYQGVQ